ncbi:SH3 domain-containing protein [Bacillus massiliglaciei]|uniref:SH3 domain-containing protein n=1 Tax=Bacillus massiliglaciei TaxID=1816693 RepID=UPI000ADA2841|nr:SH3 domain-containing protein [Bacillus massiliglaciei]
MMFKKIAVCAILSGFLFSSFSPAAPLLSDRSGMTKAEAASVTYTTTANLNVRSGSSTKYKILGTVKKGSSLNVQSKLSNGWYKIKYRSKTGYVSGSYVKASTKTAAKAKPASTSSSAVYTATANLNVRSGSSTKYKILGTVKKGSALSVQSKLSNGWYKIKYGSKTGYVSGSYVKASTKTAAKLDVEKMSKLGKAQQVILVKNTKAGSRAATIQAFEKTNGKWKRTYSMSGVVGKYGMTGSKKEGDGKTPTGKYTIGTAFYRGTMPKTKLPVKKITSDSVWVDDSKSALYNTWQSKSKTKGKWSSAENLNIPQYDRGFVINYNTARTPYKGSAIFFHVAGSSGYTAGCVATSKTNVQNILAWVNPAKNPVIIMTPEAEITKY